MDTENRWPHAEKNFVMARRKGSTDNRRLLITLSVPLCVPRDGRHAERRADLSAAARRRFPKLLHVGAESETLQRIAAGSFTGPQCLPRQAPVNTGIALKEPNKHGQ